MMTLGETSTLDKMTGAAPTNAWVLTSDESLKVKPPSITNLSRELGVVVATPTVISNSRFVKLVPGKLLTMEFLDRTLISTFCLGSR